MSPAWLSIKRPIFISCILILITVLGYRSMKSMPLDMFPDVTEPTVTIETMYPGAAPAEIETQVSKKIEDELSTISGIKKVSSSNKEGISVITATFYLDTKIENAEQDVRAKIGNIKKDLPRAVEDPVIRKVSSSDMPVMRIALIGNMPEGQFFDIADQTIRPRIEQVPRVGRVDILGGRKREIHVNLDREKLKYFDVSASQVAAGFAAGGRNIPAGSLAQGESQTSFRTKASFDEFRDIENQLVRFSGNERPIKVADVATVTDSLVDETSRTYLGEQKVLLFDIYRQSGANTVRVIDAVKERLKIVEDEFAAKGSEIKLSIVSDRSNIIHDSVYDVKEAIIVGILLTIVVVYLFLGSMRSTIITNLALPNSLLGAFIFMSLSGFSLNMMSLMGLSVVVGLLIDDAIVVRENIHKQIEQGQDPVRAAYRGTMQVMLPVISTTFAVLAVFGPIGTLDGVVGQWFKQFGLTICFAMGVSLFDAITIAPMLSAYFAGHHHREPTSVLGKLNKKVIDSFNAMQAALERVYARTLKISLKKPGLIVLASAGIFIGSLMILSAVPSTFIQPEDSGEFSVTFDLPAGSGLDATEKVAKEVASIIKKDPDVEYYLMTVGNRQSEMQKSDIFVKLLKAGTRKATTMAVKDRIRDQLGSFAKYNVKVADADMSGGSERPFNINISGVNQAEIEKYANEVYAGLKKNSDLTDLDISVREGKPEYVIESKPSLANLTGVSLNSIGTELRTRVEGEKAAIFTQNAIDYDVRVRMKESQRNVINEFEHTKVSNSMGQTIYLNKIADVREAKSSSEILRENRTKYVRISADLSANGNGLGGAMSSATKLMTEDLKAPPGITFSFPGQGESFDELTSNMATAMGLGLLIIYLVLASLYESFFKPFTIMLVIPLAACGAFFALFITRSYMDLYAMIGCILLMGLATKNSILLLDQVEEYRKEGKQMIESLVAAGENRLRPILMTSFAMIGGMIPIAIGLNEASKSRTTLGIVVIGGVISSTLLTLYTIPACAIYIEKFEKIFFRFFNRTLRSEVGPNDPRPQDVIDMIVKEKL